MNGKILDKRDNIESHRFYHSLRIFWAQYSKDKKAVLGLGIVTFFIILAVFAPLISPYDPFLLSDALYKPPSISHPLGTDSFGRDVLSRIVWGSRVSLFFGGCAASLSLLIGIVLGAIPGYFGGKIDDLFSRFFEIFLMIPRLVIIILVVAIFGSNIMYSVLVVGLTLWPTNAKIARAQVMSIKNRGYIQSTISIGAGHFRVLFYHILPNGLYPLIANSTIEMGSAILIEASLSFLGLGDLNYVSWGQILQKGQAAIFSAWWVIIFPGICIFLLVFAFSLVGDGINYALNPKLRER
jgi:peptide/nickel transport system permease protein